jgi:hypothetical protein
VNSTVGCWWRYAAPDWWKAAGVLSPLVYSNRMILSINFYRVD